MRRLGLEPNDIDTVFVTHLHGDHFGGLPWLLIDAQYVSKRTRPLIVTGPRGIEARFLTAAEALYPGMTTSEPRLRSRLSSNMRSRSRSRSAASPSRRSR